MKKVFIIGAGIAGLSVAARLLHYGFTVEIFEKNNTVGGKTGFIQYKDFKFDSSKICADKIYKSYKNFI